ncbi:unnamed protein product [Acanthoscelides obtectus]|uniref:PiggyBac transposable element-derived protein domain-containing protein n=1 Tax=Acanthoscelides obtectus TaxID=200917 RepID=A0A9P0K9I5_ACAOB|nr:unnamed protein product [Acanthoscelides obtectus]CAK1622780.1 PiggyBac transposable element-derived protein 3 [Acanthoscelides obtectus]
MIFNDDEDEVPDIYISPSEPNVLTDEDSADEDDGGLIDDLSGRQLLSDAEIHVRGVDQPTGADLEEEDVVDDSQPLSELGIEAHEELLRTLKGRKYDKRTWLDGDMTKSSHFPAPDFSEFRDMSPAGLFELFFDEGMMLYILEETKKYALFSTCPDPQVTMEELRCFLAILIVSGYNILPGKRFYWDSGEDMSNGMIKEAMRRDRFIQIMRFVHCADNTKMDPQDKMWKLRPIITRLQESFLKYYRPTEHMNYDESMIKYFGRHNRKQFIRGKPIRFGYKVWCLNSENSYLVNFDIYQGKSPRPNEPYEAAFGKAAAPLVVMLDKLPTRNLPYQLYVDNLFTSFNLLVYLKERGYGVTGTIRENRVPKDFPLEKKSMTKANRGTLVAKIDKEDGIILMRWIDNAVVTVASTSYGMNPIQQVKRYSQTEKKIIQVPRSHAIGMYNKYMGGTDRMDEDLARYRISIRSKKW